MSGLTNRWAVVGGGMLGMTLAHRLAQSGQKVTLLESADHLGGLADAWKLGDIRWDRHYHVTLLSDAHLRGVLAELGLDADLKWSETKTGFFTDGQLHSMSNTMEFLRFPPLGLLDKLRLGMTIWYASRIRNSRRLEGIYVTDWLRRWSGRRTYEKIWLPLLRAKLGAAYEDAAASFIWATISRMYAARRSGLKKEMFGYLTGGYGRLLECFQRRLRDEGVEIRVGCRVDTVEMSEQGSPIVRLAGQPPLPCDRVVLTTPAPITAKICPGLNATERDRLNALKYLGVICASLVTKQRLGGYYITNITDDVAPFTGVIEMTALVDPCEFGGHSLVYLPKYAPAESDAFDVSDEDLRCQFLEGLRRIYPAFSPDRVLAWGVSRVRNVMAIPTIGYSESVPSTRTSLPGVFIVNSAQIINGTLNVNETIRRAGEALPVLLSDDNIRT